MSAIDPAAKLPNGPMGVALSFLKPTELAGCKSLSKLWQQQTEKESLWKNAVCNMLASHGVSVEVEGQIDSWDKIAEAFSSIEKKLIKGAIEPKGEATIGNRMISYMYKTSSGFMSAEGAMV